MADVLVNTDVSTFNVQPGVVWLDADTAYYFFGDATNNDFFYTKTTDGGATWGTPVSVVTDTTDVVSGSVWWDRATPGDTGTLIHIIVARDAGNDYRHRSLDTSDDSLSTEVQAGSDGVGGGSVFGAWVTKAFNGNLYLKYNNAGNQDFRRRDTGGTWSGRSDESVSAPDKFFIFPDGNSSDEADIIMIRTVNTAERVELVLYDDSANSWGNRTTLFTATDLGVFVNIWATIRASDHHIIVAAIDEVTQWSAITIRIFDVFGTSVTEKTAITINPDMAGWFTDIFVAPNNDIYVTYIHEGTGTFDGDVKGVYVKSSDGGVTWGSEVQFTVGDTRNIDYFTTPVSLVDGGLFAPIFVDLDNTPRDAYINTDNAVTISPKPTSMSTVTITQFPVIPRPV